MKKQLIFITIILITLLFGFKSPNINTSKISDLSSPEEIGKLQSRDDIKNLRYAILIRFNYESDEYIPNIDINEKSTAEEVDKYLFDLHEHQKNYFSNFNAQILSDLNLSKDVFTISQYSPFAEAVFSSLDEYNYYENLIKKVSDNDKILWVNFFPLFDFITEASTRNNSELLGDYPISDALTSIGVSYPQTYNGNGIQIGIIDEGNTNLSPYLSGRIVSSLTTVSSAHTALVASIAGGDLGVARNASFHIISLNYFSNMVAIFTQLIQWNVNIVNCSFLIDITGNYEGYDAFFDYVIRENLITIVKSAGNRGSAERNVTNPGLGLNVITVGSISKNGNISSHSSYNVASPSSEVIFKPNLVAPGEYIKVGSLPSDKGTSFAAPFVTGVSALLMEEFPTLKTNPQLLEVALMGGANRLNGQTSFYDAMAGSGLVNYQNSRNIILNNTYQPFVTSSSRVTGDVVSSKTVTLPAQNRIYISLLNLINSDTTTYTSNLINPLFSKYKIQIINSSGTVIATYNSNYNIQHLEYTNVSISPMTITIRIILNGPKIGNIQDFGSFVYTWEHVHVHYYSDYYVQTSSATTHQAYCSCGDFINESHHWSMVSYSGGLRQQCNDCGKIGFGLGV